MRSIANCEVKISGRFLVCPAILQAANVVLNGSTGPLFYGRNQVAASADKWNGVPIVLNHPPSFITDEYVLAYGLGFVRNVVYDLARDLLIGTAWLDWKRADALDKRILDKLYIGNRLPVSAANGGNRLAVANVGPDIRTATDIIPDHVAVLLDSLPACSKAGIYAYDLFNC